MSRVTDIVAELRAIIAEHNPEQDTSPGTVFYDLALYPLALSLANSEEALDTYRNNYSLRQVLQSDDPDSASVDNLLSNFNVVRRSGTRAAGRITVFVSRPISTSVPSGTRFRAASDIQLETEKAFVGYFGTSPGNDTATLSYVQMRQIRDDLYAFTIEAVTSDILESALSPGQTLSSTLTNANITRYETASTFTGGSAPETTNELLLRASTGVNARVVTGRGNICALLRENTNNIGTGVPVLSCQAVGMGDALMLRDVADDNGVFRGGGGCVDVYARTAQIPSIVTASISGTREDGAWTLDIDRESFPGAYGVLRMRFADQLLVPSSFTTSIGFEQEDDAPLMSSAAHARYSAYQTMSVTFELPDDPIAEDAAEFEVDVMYMPGLLSLQSYMQSKDIRNYAFDTLVKAPVPIVVGFDVELRYLTGLVPPSVADVQQAVADAVNVRAIGLEALHLSEVVFACRRLFPESRVQMPVHGHGRIWLPDGTTQDTSSQSKIQPPAGIVGVSADNVAYFCFPSNVNVRLVEVFE